MPTDGRPTLRRFLNRKSGMHMEIENVTVAYSRGKNIREAVTQSKLYQHPGEEVSVIMEQTTSSNSNSNNTGTHLPPATAAN